MPSFSMDHQTAAGSDLALINLTGSATMRVGIYEFGISSDASPADLAGEFALNRTTDVGTGGTALTAVKHDPLSAAAVATGRGGTFTADPTDTANTVLWEQAVNQKATFRWAALADRYRFFSIAAANNGLMMRSVSHGGTPNINCIIMWDE